MAVMNENASRQAAANSRLRTNVRQTRGESMGEHDRPSKETLIDTFVGLFEFLKNVLDPLIEVQTASHAVGFYCDMEGNNLGRHGTSSLLQITIKPLAHTLIFDLTVLKSAVFNMPSPKSHSLREILESDAYPTFWWDLRSDQAALYFHYAVKLSPTSTVDLQLLEIATRAVGPMSGRNSRTRVGLGVAIANEANVSNFISAAELETWTATKDRGRRYFKSVGYGVFDKRPLSDLCLAYAGQDTIYMPNLHNVYMARISKSRYTMEQIEGLTREAIELSCSQSAEASGNSSQTPALFH